MKTSMSFACQIFEKKSGVLNKLTKKQTTGLCIGDFFFVVDGKEIPFDWDDFNGSEENGVFSFETGYGWGKDFELSNCHDLEYTELGLKKEEIGAKFLASTERISEIHMNFIDENGDECDIGTNSATEDFRIKLLNVILTDIETGAEYPVAQSVIDEFNNRT